MGGFRNESLNIDFESGVIDLIIAHVIKCCEAMKNACIETSNNLHKKEDKITNRLVEGHLNENNSIFRFILQSPENYIPNEDRHRGRTDIKVVSLNWFDNQLNYYTIECKRIDGKSNLNKAYISDGVARFVVNPPKYSSYNKKNIMLGYVVQIIDIPNNASKIDNLQNNLLGNVAAGKFVLIENLNSEYYLYSCRYQLDSESLELRHLFYDFSNVMQN